MYEKRERITLDDDLMKTILKMSEGNPGAATVCGVLLKHAAATGEPMTALMDMLHLDDMNIRGTQIWIAFKDFAGQDLDKFIEAVRHRDPEMIARVNEVNEMQGHPAVAVARGGASGYDD